MKLLFLIHVFNKIWKELLKLLQELVTIEYFQFILLRKESFHVLYKQQTSYEQLSTMTFTACVVDINQNIHI